MIEKFKEDEKNEMANLLKKKTTRTKNERRNRKTMAI